MTIQQDLKLVKKCQKEIILINQAYGLLSWDQQTYLPSNAAESRSEQLAMLHSISHEKATSEKLFKAVQRLLHSLNELEEDDKLMILRLDYDLSRARKLPREFVEEFSKAESLSFAAWQEAKKKKDFSIFLPHLERIVELSRRKADYYGFKKHPYDALLESYEEGMTIEKLKPEFDKLKAGLIKLLRKIESSKEYLTHKTKFMNQNFPQDKQLSILKEVIRKIGLSEEFSRVDIAEHPFSTKIGKNDARITTNFRDKPLFSFESSIHEAGHALYELGLPKEHEFNFLGESPSLGIHESQSRFWENMIGKSESFWKYYFVKFRDLFELEDDFEQWFREVNRVSPGKIRIESDEVHYCLHVILRFELESALIEGTLEARDLPEAWNKKMQEFFRVIPDNDSEGVMQDVHWSEGYFGYFPTYALGSIYAVQLYNALVKEMPDIEQDIEKGEFSRIRDWLRKKVHQHGRRLLAEGIIQQACGEGLNVETYLNYLNKKYTQIYNLE